MKEEFVYSKKKDIQEKIRLNRKVVTFLVCLFISAFFWLLMSLSKEYDEVIRFPVNYEHVPTDKVIANELPEFIDVEVHARGFVLLRYKLFEEREKLQIDLRDARPMSVRNHFYLDPNFRLDKLINQFKGRMKINAISPDTIFLNFNKKSTKVVPIKASLKLSFASTYQLDDSVMLEPSTVEVSGAADVLSKIQYVPTIPLEMKDVKASVSVKLDLMNYKQAGLIDYSVKQVIAKLKVSKFTEGSLELPVQVLHVPPGYSLKTFPDKVTVKYAVGFENYEKVDPSQFQLAVDYDKVSDGNNKLKVQLLKAPAEVRNVRLETEKVEYIIRK